METIIIVIAVLCGAFCLVSIISLIRDMIVERRKKEEPETVPQPVSQAAPVTVVVSQSQPAPEPTPVPEQVPVPAPDGAISFEADIKRTFEDRFKELTPEAKGWWREIARYAAKIEGITRRKRDRFEEFKLGSSRIVRLTFKRGGTFACEFIFENDDFRSYMSQNKLAVRSGATEIRILDAEMVEAAKRSIDIALEAAIKQKEERKQFAKERRKQKRLQQKEEEEEAAAAEAEAVAEVENAEAVEAENAEAVEAVAPEVAAEEVDEVEEGEEGEEAEAETEEVAGN